jgi:hypothetical protein
MKTLARAPGLDPEISLWSWIKLDKPKALQLQLDCLIDCISHK